jgi:tRNA A37 methylthiotransferase MiaB
MDWTPELIELGAGIRRSRIARHAHLPLQSGSDSVLRRMHRRYRPWHYEQKAGCIARCCRSGAGFGADVMVGFPGETEAEFRETYDFIAGCHLPIFTSSRFPRVPARGAGSCIGKLQSHLRQWRNGWLLTRSGCGEKTQQLPGRFCRLKLPAIYAAYSDVNLRLSAVPWH